MLVAEVAPSPGRLTVRTKRRTNGVQWRLHKPGGFVFEHPWVLATGPEQMVFDELVRRHIYFHFQELLTEAVPETRNIGMPVLDMPAYRADFIIPAYKIVLDPWDDFHHSDPKQAQDDARKLATYQALGFTTYHVWASELQTFGVAWWFNQIPQLTRTARGGYKLYHTTDDSAGIVSANQARRSFKAPTLRTRRSRGRRAA